MKLIRVLLPVLLLLVVGIQFVPVERTNPPVVSEVKAPAEVKELLRRACYDCHSNETRWPWYSYVAPLSWRVAGHVQHGREDLNFSDWPTFRFDEQAELLEEIREELTEGSMPLRDYLWVHPEARLTDGERKRILSWAGVGSPDDDGGKRSRGHDDDDDREGD